MTQPTFIYYFISSDKQRQQIRAFYEQCIIGKGAVFVICFSPLI